MNYTELNLEQFKLKECVVAGDDCLLINPSDMGTDWNDDNARFRSCIVRKSDGFIISQGFKKFTNFSEKPDFQPWDNSWKFEARHKLDGSLLIISRYKGEWILRTRGTVDARNLANGHEIEFLLEKYKSFFNEKLSQSLAENLNNSFLFEWLTPTNIIVLRESSEPKLIFLAVINHDKGGIYIEQSLVDTFNDSLKEPFERPTKYEYDSIEACILDVGPWKGKEGVVLHSPDYQTLKKIKASEYCELHKICTGIKTINQVVDLFISAGKFVEYEDFYRYVETTLDFEVAEKIKDDMAKIVEAYNKVLEKLEKVKNVIDNVRGESYSRKDQAFEIMQNFSDWRKAAGFLILDGKEVDDRIIKDAIVLLLTAAP